MSVNKKNSDGSYNQYASKPYVTKDNIGLSRVENKSSEDIRGEITSKNVTDALGYTPVSEEELDNILPTITAASTASAIDRKSVVFSGTGKALENLKVGGRTVQDGVPTPDAPVEVLGVGDYDEETGKYKIPVSCNGETTNIYLDAPLYKNDILSYTEGKTSFTKIINASELSWIRRSNYWVATLPDVVIPSSTSVAGEIYSNCYTAKSYSTLLYTDTAMAINTDGTLWVANNASSDQPVGYFVYKTTVSKTETIELPTFPTVLGTNTFAIDTSVTPTNVTVISYGDYVTKKEFIDNSKYIASEISTIKGTADDQFTYDTEAKMTKIVPDGVNKGIVAMIGGKTEKRNLFSGYTNLNGYSISSEMYNGHQCIVSSSAWAGAYNMDLTLVPNKTYIIRAMIKASVANTKYALYGTTSSGTINLGDSNIVTIVNADTWTEIWIKFTPTVNTSNIRIECTVANVTTTISEFMVSVSNVLLPYLPFGMFNAPVEKITLTNKNAYYEDTAEHKVIDGSGNIVDNDGTRITDYIPLETGMKIYTDVTKSAISAYLRVAYYTSDKTFISRTVYNAKEGFSFETLTIPSNAVYVLISPDISIKKLVATSKELTSVPDRTVISIPSEILNLPDYGCSVGDVYNYVDFENMVYHHRVTTKKGSDISGSWTREAIYNYYSILAPSDCKRVSSASDVANIICDIYTTTSNYNYNGRMDKSISMSAGGNLGVVDSSNPTDVIEKLKTMTIYYELAEEELIPLTDILLPFKSEPGGTVTFENEHNLDVPNTVIYEKEMK